MENCELTISEDDVLTIVVDLKKEVGWTKHRNSMRIGSTEGNMPLWKNGKPHPKRIRVNCNVFRSLTEDEKEKAREGCWWK